MNIHEVGGWHPLPTAARPLAPLPYSPCSDSTGEGMQCGPVPVSWDGS